LANMGSSWLRMKVASSWDCCASSPGDSPPGAAASSCESEPSSRGRFLLRGLWFSRARRLGAESFVWFEHGK
jgi:hypothetical protein